MLILVAVTINMAVNGGLFGYAGKATGETQNAIDAEQQLANGRVQIDGKWYDSIDDYLAGDGTIKISYDYDKTEGLESTTVNLKLDITGVPTFEEYAEEYLEDKNLEAEYIKAIMETGSFENFIDNNYEKKDNFVKEIEERTGLEYEQGLKAIIIESGMIQCFYITSLYGGIDKVSLEALFVKTINYQGSFEDFIEENYASKEVL